MIFCFLVFFYYYFCFYFSLLFTLSELERLLLLLFHIFFFGLCILFSSLFIPFCAFVMSCDYGPVYAHRAISMCEYKCIVDAGEQT